MSVSDDFTILKEKVEEADRDIRDAVERDDAALRAMVDKVQKRAEDRAAQLGTTATEIADEAESRWNEVKSDWDRHIQRIRQQVEAKEAAHDVKVAERDADQAEADALDAVSFAEAAIEEAHYAVLDAVLARRSANVMAAAKS
jgi:hypothetical protein